MIDVNFMQEGEGHCFKCHKEYPPNNQHILTCKGEITPCTEKCGRWLESYKKLTEENYINPPK